MFQPNFVSFRLHNRSVETQVIVFSTAYEASKETSFDHPNIPAVSLALFWEDLFWESPELTHLLVEIWMFPKIVGQRFIIPCLIGFSIIFTIHFGGPPLFWKHPICFGNHLSFSPPFSSHKIHVWYILPTFS